jgi:hypothetical protein
MGCFDEVRIPCPKCGEPYTAQSKGGDCTLETYNFDGAPADVLGYLVDVGSMQCESCGTIFRVVATYDVEIARNPA